MKPTVRGLGLLSKKASLQEGGSRPLLTTVPPQCSTQGSREGLVAVWGCIALTPETVIPSDFPTNARNPQTRTRAGASSTQRSLELCLEQTGKGLKVVQGVGSLLCLS